MTLQEIAQLLGAIGVIASLIYVAIQIRDNARSVRAATYQQLSDSLTSGWDMLANNDTLCGLFVRGGDDFESLDRIEKARFTFIVMSFGRHHENAWYQHKIGILREEDWTAISSDMQIAMSIPGIHSAWQLVKSRYSPEFRTYVDEGINKVIAAQAAKPAQTQVHVITKRKAPRSKMA